MSDYKPMFEQAVRSLAAIDDALGIGDDGCGDLDQTLTAIAALKSQAPAAPVAVPQGEPVAARYDFDGYGYLYIDNGHGSDWETRIPDAEMLYTKSDEAEIRADERERCAKLCEAISDEYQKREGMKWPELKTDAQEGAATCAHRIRERGQG